MMRSLIAALRFLTRIPCPGPATTTTDLTWAIGWFPLVGAGCGAAIGAVAIAAAPWWGAGIAAVLAVAVGLVVTGGFHEDAASDAADGLGGGATTERIIAIMHDSRVGAYGSMALWVLLSLRTLLLWRLLELHPQAPLIPITAMALASGWGRWTAAPLVAMLKPLSTGLSRDLTAGATGAPLALASALMVGLSSFAVLGGLTPWVVLSAAGAVLATTGAWAWYLHRRLGGHTGDLLGAGNQLCEIIALLVLTAA